MLITSESDINGGMVRQLRAKSNLMQRQFWARVGVSQSNGSHIESGHCAISKPLRILLFVNYVAGIELDASTPEGVARILKLAQRQPGARAKAAATQSTTPT